jgi:hypothetical protein
VAVRAELFDERQHLLAEHIRRWRFVRSDNLNSDAAGNRRRFRPRREHEERDGHDQRADSNAGQPPLLADESTPERLTLFCG